MSRSVRRALVGAALSALLPLALASAHAELDSASPGPDEVVAGSPTQLVARFTQDIAADRTSIEVRDADGLTVARGGKDPDRARVQRVELPPLEPGTYEVRWVTFSTEDDELARGRYRFTVTEAPATPAPTLAPTEPCPSPVASPAPIGSAVPVGSASPIASPAASAIPSASPGLALASPDASPALDPTPAPIATPDPCATPAPTTSPAASPIVPAASSSPEVEPRAMSRSLAAATLGAAAVALLPMPVAAHGLSGRYDAPLPLAVYLAGAAVAVGLSFLFAFLSQGRWQPRPVERTRRVPTVVVLGLKALGLLAWGWIVAQVIVGGSSSAEVGSLFTWVYGWVGLAIVCAVLGPVWSWVDPFTSLHDAGAWIVRRLGLRAPSHATLPAGIAAWPAVALFAFIVWLELAYLRADMGLVVVGYTLLTLAGMAVFGRDAWREHVEVFSVWFGLLGRLALYVPAGTPGSPLVRRQHFPDGLLGRPWDASLVALVAVSVGAILYDGLSQTEPFFDLFGLPAIAGSTALLLGFLAIVAALALWLVRGASGRRRSGPASCRSRSDTSSPTT